MGDQVYEVILDGGGPWGFRLQGGKDFGIPLNVARITPGSKANMKKLMPGDQIVEINGTDVEPLSHMEAQNLIKNAGSRLQLKLKPGKASGAMAANPKVLTTTHVVHSAGVDHQYNAKPKVFNPGSPASINVSVSPARSVSPEPRGPVIQAPKFDPSAYAKKKKEELDKLKEKKKETVQDSDILKMINQTKISDEPRGGGAPPENEPQQPPATFRMAYTGRDIHEEVNPGSNVLDNLKARQQEEKAGLHSESKVPSRVFQMLQKQYDDDDAEDLPPPPPELIGETQDDYNRPSFGNPGYGQQSKTFRMLQDAVNEGKTHESVFSRPPEERNRAVPMPVQHQPKGIQSTTVNPIPKAPMPQGPNYKISSPKAPSFRPTGTASPPSSTWKPPGTTSPPASTWKPPGTTSPPASTWKPPGATSPPNAPSYTPAQPSTYSPSNAESNGQPYSPPQAHAAPQRVTTKTPPEPTSAVDSKRQPHCAGCNEVIRGPFVTAIGKTWHPEHFCCASCGNSLQNQGFVEEEGKLYCEKCFNDFFAPKCAACGNAIIGNCVNAIGKTFHPEHFVCHNCGKNFSGEGFLIEGGNPYCENCYDSIFSVKCGGCNRSIGGGERYVEALDRNWHTDCFCCAVCRQRLEGTSFYVIGGRPLCALHKSGS